LSELPIIVNYKSSWRTKPRKKLFHNNLITYHFIPSRAAHFGFLWEAAVKSVLLYRTLINSRFTFEEPCTITAEVEAMLNSRPLSPLCPDTLVIIHDDNLSPRRWKIGRVESVVPGQDGLIRVAHVRASTVVCCRPVHTYIQHFPLHLVLNERRSFQGGREVRSSSSFPSAGLTLYPIIL